MGFFGGLITLQAVIVLLVVFLMVGFVAGIGVVVYMIKERYPESFEKLKQEIDEGKKNE